MRRIITMLVDEGNEEEIKVNCFENGARNIIITTTSEERLPELLSLGLKKANETDFEAPAEEEKKEPKPTKLELLEDYKNTPSGARFIKSLDNAVKFYWKNIKDNDYRAVDIEYVAAKHNNNLWAAMTDIGALYYRLGYSQARKAYKNK